MVTAVGGTWPYFLAMARDMEVREMFHSLVNKGGFVPFVKNLANSSFVVVKCSTTVRNAVISSYSYYNHVYSRLSTIT